MHRGARTAPSPRLSCPVLSAGPVHSPRTSLMSSGPFLSLFSLFPLTFHTSNCWTGGQRPREACPACEKVNKAAFHKHPGFPNQRNWTSRSPRGHTHVPVPNARPINTSQHRRTRACMHRRAREFAPNSRLDWDVALVVAPCGLYSAVLYEKEDPRDYELTQVLHKYYST